MPKGDGEHFKPNGPFCPVCEVEMLRLRDDAKPWICPKCVRAYAWPFEAQEPPEEAP